MHPKNYKKGMKLFDPDGVLHEVLDTCVRGGVVYATLTGDSGAVFIVYDMHDYDGRGGDTIPKFYSRRLK